MITDSVVADPRSAVRFLDLHSGRNDILGSMTSVGAMLATVALRLEGGRPGSRFPLLQLVRRAAPLSPAECDALVREVTRLKSMLAPMPLDLLEHVAPTTPAGGESATNVSAPIPELFPRLNGNGAPKNLSDEFAWPMFVLDHVARLGAASGRGARFESGDVDSFRAVRTPLSPHGSLPTDPASLAAPAAVSLPAR